MKYIFSIIVFLHGAIHLLGFIKAFKLAEVEQLTMNISKISGGFWLLAFILFIVAGISYLAEIDWWYFIAIFAVIISTILIFSAWSDAKFGTIANLLILLVAIVGYGTSTFRSKYENDVKEGLNQNAHIQQSLLTEKDIEHLPEPVKNYIRYAGALGKPKVNSFRLEFTGKIRKDEQSEWMPFTTVQYNFIESTTRLFFMNAEMKNLPVAGYHCFKNGKASMDIRLFSLFKVQYQSGQEMDTSETVTFFNDMCCMAPATLIDKRIKWLKVDGNKVHAEFVNNNITISAWLFFNEKSELVNFISEDRYASGENNTMEKLPWSTPLKEYKDLNGYKITGYAETIYTYPSGDFCYGTFNVSNIEYNCEELK